MQETRLWSLVRKIPWRRKWQSTSVLLLGKSYRQRSLVGHSQWGHRESDMTERPHFFIHDLSHSQLPVSFLLTVQSFGCKEYNQSDFSIDHLVMSMYRVLSCVVGRGCLLWPVRSLGKTLLAFVLLHSVLPRPNLPVTPDISWLPTFPFQSPMMKRTSFFWC